MSGLTKSQRRKRRKMKSTLRRKKVVSKVQKKKKQEPWVPVKMKMFNMPDIFPPELSKEKRIEIVRSIGEKAKEDFNKKYPEIEKWFKNYDPLYILSFCAFYFTSQPEGVDLEATGKMEFFHHYLEIMQAFSLIQERSYELKPLLGQAENLHKEMKEIGELMQLRLVGIPSEIKTDEEIHSYRLRMEMMAHTTAVRNWAYYHQMRRVVLDLATLIRTDFEKVYRIDSFKFFELLFKLSEERNDLLNKHRDEVRKCIRKPTYQEMITTYNETYPEIQKVEGDKIETLWEYSGKNKKSLASMLICHSDLRLDKIYSFTIEHAHNLYDGDIDIKVLNTLFSGLSFKFGDLKETNKDHIVLSNPVLNKPFIQVDEKTFYSAVWGIMPHLSLDILEDLIWGNEELKEKYLALKSQYLEDQVENLFVKGFPNASIFRGSKWNDPRTGKEFENDLLVLVDSFAIVVESKSGSVTDPAKRGAPERLFKTLKELIEEPSEQALRFISFLQDNKKIHTFQTKKGTLNTVDNTKIKYYIPLGVTLSHLGSIGSNLKKLIESNVVDKKLEELAPSVNMTDLESIFDLLPLEAEKIHYLARRREFEAHVHYEGDELDLLGFYLDNGFNIGEHEYSQDIAMNISLKSKELDPYFIGSNEGIVVKKPQLAMTKWWKDLLNTISSKRTEGWLETCFALLNSTEEDQKKFENAFKKLVNLVEKGKVEKPHNWAMFLSGPDRRRYAIAGYPYTTTDKELRNSIMSGILDDEQAEKSRGVVVIGVNINRRDYPYSVLARRLSTDLFDTLTIPPKEEDFSKENKLR